MPRPVVTARPVLVVEDNPVVRRMLVRSIESQGVRTVVAANGEEGLAALRRHRPSLIVLDLAMPVMDGWRFREAQLNLAEPELAAVPVVLLSADLDVARHAEALHAIAGLSKPVDLGRLWTVVRPYCGDAVRPTIRAHRFPGSLPSRR